MPKRYDGWMRLRTPDGSLPPADLVVFARKKLGELLDYSSFAGLGSTKRIFTMDDGSIVQVQWDGTTPIVTIIPVSSEEREVPQDYPLWIPRGFVVYPAWHDAKAGVGLPVIQEGDDPYAQTNLAPGLAKARWTVNGVCGEVLISPDKDAAYPTNRQFVETPLLFHPTRGPTFRWAGKTPFDQRPKEANWASYRIEFEVPRQHYPDEDAAGALTLHEDINTARTGGGLQALYLLPRGYYKKAQVATYIMLAAGSIADYNVNYPPTYQHSYDRLTKDGVSNNIIAQTLSTWARGDDLTQYELRANAASAASALAQWQADPGSNSRLMADVGRGAFGDVGARGGYWAASIEDTTGWIMAGNQWWQSGNTDIPIISWYGFASISLGWDTFPCYYDADHWDTAPLIPRMTFTSSTTGDCWMNYTRSATPTAHETEPAMSRHIFCRGRRIAIAPRGGLVWGACLQTVNGVDRLIALVHHPEDQPSDPLNGMTRYLRVWWCDIPQRTNLRADPQNVICGEATDDTWGWKGGQQIDLGVMPDPTVGTPASGTPNSLKYASAWRFSPDGTKAVCLRDYGAVIDYQALFSFGNIVNNVEALNARTVELTFDCTTSTTTTSVVFYDYLPGRFAPHSPISGPLDVVDSIEPGYSLYQAGALPIAVDYDTAGNRLYVFSAAIRSNENLFFDYNGIGYTYTYEYIYLGIGGAGTRYASDLRGRALVSSVVKTPGTDFVSDAAVVADVRSASFVVLGHRPWHEAGVFSSGPPPCRFFTDDAVCGGRIFKGGQMLRETWFANPDGFVPSVADTCYQDLTTVSAVTLSQSTTQGIQAYYGKRFDGEVLSYQFSPVPQAATMLNSEPSGAACGCGITINQFFDSTHIMDYPEWAPRGGGSTSTIPLPDNDWLIYTKVV